jgi:hypothetical protein
MIIYPGFSIYSVSNAFLRVIKMTTVLREQNEGFVKKKLVDVSLLPVRAVIGIWAGFPIQFRNGAALMI